MNGKICIVTAVILITFFGVYFALFGEVSYEVVSLLPANSHAEDIQRDKDSPVTIAVMEEYISVLPPYGYEVEFIDVIRDGGITMLYNLKKLEDSNGEASAFTVKVSNPLKGPIGATCLNIY